MTEPTLREAAEAAMTDFVFANGSDFNEAEWPGFAALRAALAAPTPRVSRNASGKANASPKSWACTTPRRPTSG